MARNHAHLFSDVDNDVAAICKALAHPARVAIINHLITRGACVCGSIVEAVPLAQSTVSQHLAALKDAGLISGTIDGASVCYCVTPEGAARLQRVVSMLTSMAESATVTSCC
jgi:predicted transcriptional regulator